MTQSTAIAPDRAGAVSIILCFVAAIMEGADIVSMGLAAPLVTREYGFGPGDLSLILTAAIVGLMIGAAIGGRLGDRVGRKSVLIAAFVMLSIFSLATAFATSLTGFIAIRLLCGLGLGAAFPNLIAIASEAATPQRRATAVGLMFCGQPIGGTLLALFVAGQTDAFDWRLIFYIGGVLPLILTAVLAAALPESRLFRQERARAGDTPVQRPDLGAVLFGDGRGATTLLLWVSYAFTQVVVYLLNNWLPTLMVGKGLLPQQAGMISAIENAAAAAGCVILAYVADRGYLRAALLVAYIATAASLWALGAAQGMVALGIAGAFAGFFAIGGQLVLYTMAPACYPTIGRTTGVGAAIAAGRLGAIAGPLGAGALLAAGALPATVLIAAVPCVAVAGIAALAVTRRKSGDDLFENERAAAAMNDNT